MDRVNENARFIKDDKFDRERYMQMCEKLISNHPAERGACTIAVDAPWGIGKSTFLRMWINELLDNNESISADEPSGKYVLPVYYNAWESDFCDSALAPLLFSFCAMVDRKQDENCAVPKDEGIIKKVISTSLGLLAAIGIKAHGGDDIVAQAAGTTVEMTTSGIMDILSKRAVNATDEPAEGSIGDIYDTQLQARDAFRDALIELSQKFGGVYIFIDELDRCKPSFAIDTLDVIKHYFDIPGITFIFGVDMLQLGHAISGRYGFNYDAEGYLSKFFEHHIVLPTPTAEQMIRFSAPKASLYADTYKRLDDIFRACQVSPRESSRIVKASETLMTLLWQKSASYARDIARELVFLLASMRFRLPHIYRDYINGRTEWNAMHWGEQDTFWEMLSYFSPFMTMTAQDCADHWHELLEKKNPPVANDEKLKNYACVGRAIVYCTDYRESDTFGQCIFRFMEQVYI